MSKSIVICLLAVGAVSVIGCKDDESKAPSQPPMTDTTAPSMSSTTQPSTGAMTAPMAPTTAPSVPSTGATTPGASATPAIPAAPAVDSTATTPAATPASADVAADSQTLLEKIQKAIKDNKLDDADADLKKLEAMKDKLPASMQQQLTALRTSIDAGKATGGVKLPGLPGSDNK